MVRGVCVTTLRALLLSSISFPKRRFVRKFAQTDEIKSLRKWWDRVTMHPGVSISVHFDQKRGSIFNPIRRRIPRVVFSLHDHQPVFRLIERESITNPDRGY